MYGAENGYDVRGLRPVDNNMDASLRIYEEKGMGYLILQLTESL